MAENIFYSYYSQTGRGPGPYFKSRFPIQHGRGWFTHILRRAWGYLKPLASSAAKHVAAESLRTGQNILQDSVAHPDVPLKTIARRRGQEAVDNLTNAAVAKLQGKGTRRRRRATAKRKAPAIKACGKKRKGTSLAVPSIRDLFSPP